MRKILVIKLSALGDLVLATGPFKAIRAYHANDHITLLTTKAFAGFGRDCGAFDSVLVDSRPRWINPRGWLDLRKALQGGRFERVYDLQTNDRTKIYARLFGKDMPEWSGERRGATLHVPKGWRDIPHAFDRHVAQLKVAGINDVPLPDVGWMKGDADRFDLPDRFALLVPSTVLHRPQKRWPETHFAALAQALIERGITSVIIGTSADASVTARVAKDAPGAVDLTGRTTLDDIAALARIATLAVGNDTGPMHLIAASRCPTLVLFSSDSRPERSAPKGEFVDWIHVENLKTLTVARVIDALPAVF
ncbi:MAG: glycosyltransferase family 9 protein [Pseudomonadota bacterium]|nr:glycosyltransferase family 9 protein [Pseudomonadota bacterium]